MLVIAHRGASGHAPENTLAAFRQAVALGATFIETDLQLTRDARFVAIHDDTVNRTTNGQGTVHDLTLAEVRKLDAGSWFGSEFAGERVPTLRVVEGNATDTTVDPGEQLRGSGVDFAHRFRARQLVSDAIPATMMTKPNTI